MLKSLNNFVKQLTTRRVSCVGESVSKLANVQFADYSKIDSANWFLYSTCRGHMPKERLTKVIDIIIDSKGIYTEDQKDDAVYEGLCDWLCHQYTFYSVTPLFLHHLLKYYPQEVQSNEVLNNFVDLCKLQGSKAIWLTSDEIIRNRLGCLPIFRIEDVLSYSEQKV